MFRTRPAALALISCVVAALACSGGPSSELLEAYRSARDTALKPPGPPANGWSPDAILQLSPQAVESLLQVGVKQLDDASWTLDVPGVRLTPKLHVDTVQLGASKACEACFSVDVVIEGPIRYDAGMLGKGKIPTTIQVDLDLDLQVGSAGDGFPVTATLQGVRRVRIELEGIPKQLSDVVEPSLTEAVRAQALKQLAPLEIARPGTQALPLRALRVVPQGGGVRLELLTASGRPATVEPSTMSGDWCLDVATDALVALAARAAFEAGPQDLGLVGEPRGLRMDNEGKLHLDVRLWRTEGNGWWRDLDIVATHRLGPRALQLTAESADVVDQSKGAAAADPLAWLAESLILDEIEQAAAFALPTIEKAKLGSADAKMRLEGIEGHKGAIRSWGRLTVE